MDRRKIEEQVFKVLMIGSTLSIIVMLVLIIGVITARGLPYLTLDMITKSPQGGFYLGKEGGILNAILGSLYLALGATILALVISLPIAIYINLYAKRGSMLTETARFSLDILCSVPSIVYGAFGFIIMLQFGLKTSLLGGIITVALLIFPIMCRAMDEVIQMVPEELADVSLSLGSTRFEHAFKVVARQTLPGLFTAILIAFGRGIGDAASVLFTAGFTDSIPTSLFSPVATLPLAIFFQLGSPLEEVKGRAYASALILTAIILIISVAARLLSARFSKHVIK